MTKSDTGESLAKEFADLMKQHEAAWSRYRESEAIVLRKFSAIADSRSRANPTEVELMASSQAWQDVQRIKARIDDILERLKRL